MGREVRGVSELQPGVFERPGKIVGVESELVVWIPEGRAFEWRSRLEDLEFMPPVCEKKKFRTGRLSHMHLREVRWRIPDLTEKFVPKQLLEDTHIALGAWLIHRDLVNGECGSVQQPHLMAAQVVHKFTHSTELEGESRAQAAEILSGAWRKHGLLGFPIFRGGHWTLLVLRRSTQFKYVRYYDSLEILHKGCLAAAQDVLKLLEPFLEFPERRNRTRQTDQISCGLFVLHYWEGEVRQFRGEGWVVGLPTSKVVQNLFDKLLSVTSEIAQWKDKELPVPKKKKKILEEVSDPALGPREPKVENILEYLKKEAHRASQEGLVPFYGCSRCRWSRGGCISWKCNPEKFAKHWEKHPEKYASCKKELQVAEEHKLSMKELLGS